MSVHGAGERIRREVTTWPGVVSKPHQFGAVEYDVGARQLGHVHTNVSCGPRPIAR